ncbi:ParB/RepB/Spo0J family partition protein [Sulfurimonas sp. SAG-AH-194-I05]|nr:ParB/RepB/Spo0J family partition protein [Sulfurimonas sp. SAG-AH-194-I05]MDF1875663.1 ParB/RepB/Spo0J family partition protein [Sulfurimonas sp. SAG-AH-194-I05]
MAKKRNRISAEMSKTIAESSPLIKKSKTIVLESSNENNSSTISLDKLIMNPYQPRIDINIHTLNELISSIEQNGLMQPIIITEKKETGLHTIVAGHRRYEAFKIMGKHEIPTIIMPNLLDKDLAILSLTENLMRENLHPIENAIAIKNILDKKIVESQNKLAEYVGLSKGYVSKLMNILKLPTSIIEKIKADNYKDINILLLLNKLDNSAQMLEAYNVVKGLSRSDAEKYIKSTYLSKETSLDPIINIKETRTKISVNIDIKKLNPSQIELITKEIKELDKKILDLFSTWK